MRTHRTPRGFTLIEAVLLIAAAALLLAVSLPVLGAVANANDTKASLSNLRTLGVAHLLYAADWNGRQVSHTVDDLAEYGQAQDQAFSNFFSANGDYPPDHTLGWAMVQGQIGLLRYPNAFSGNRTFAQPYVFNGFFAGYGAFRMPSSRPFHDYLNGRFYDPVFYAPADTVALDFAHPAFDSPFEYVQVENGATLGDIPVWASYCMSPAAQFDPLVLSPGGEEGVYRDPYQIDTGFTAPSLFAAQFANLKTFMIEHNWNQSRPGDPCNPSFPEPTYFGCEPYFFNHGLASTPATLFFDLSTRLLPNTEVKSADDTIFKADGIGLWSRDTPAGPDGYFSEFAFDDLQLSHHILTVEGILGRDTIASPPPLPVTVR